LNSCLSKPTEEWRSVPGFEGRYEVSNHGRVKSLPNSRRRTELILQQGVHKRQGHRIINLTGHDGTAHFQKTYWVHRLVLEAFVGPAPLRMEGCHNDGDPANNHIDNLRWGTDADNQGDRIAHGTSNRGKRNGHNVLDECQVVSIKLRLEAGESAAGLAREHFVHPSTVKNIKHGRNWAWL
jgi:hypothetical protein